MKKKDESSERVQTFWRNILLKGEVFSLARKYRKLAGIPINGFRYSEDYEDWRGGYVKKESETSRRKNVNDFIDEAKEIIPYQGFLSETHYRLLMIEFYYHNNVDSEYLIQKENSLFDVVTIKNQKTLIFEDEIEDGVYIKIGPFSTSDSIRKYITTSLARIKSAQDHFVKTTKLTKPPKLYRRKNFNRDYTISFLNTLSRKELEDMGATGSYRETLIAKIMKRLGYTIQAEAVKMVIQRFRKLEKSEYVKPEGTN